jgi:hypothetical protein
VTRTPSGEFRILRPDGRPFAACGDTRFLWLGSSHNSEVDEHVERRMIGTADAGYARTAKTHGT